MSTAVFVECGGGASALTLRYLAQDWRVVSALDSERTVAEWRRKAAESPRDWEVHLYEVSDAVAESPRGIVGRVVGGGGDPTPCADLGGRLWFAELRKVGFVGWTSEERIAWAPTAVQVAELNNRPGSTEGGLYVERMAPVWYAAGKKWVGETVGGTLAGLANLIGEVFGTAALAFLQSVGPWALVLLAGWLAVKVIA